MSFPICHSQSFSLRHCITDSFQRVSLNKISDSWVLSPTCEAGSMLRPCPSSRILHLCVLGDSVITDTYSLSNDPPVIGSTLIHLQVLIVCTLNTWTDVDYRLKFGSSLFYFHYLVNVLCIPTRSKLVYAMKVLNCGREMRGSNFGRIAFYLEWWFSWFFSVHQDECKDSTLVYTIAVSVYMLSNS
jgi:hypothetical protein